MRLLLPNVPSRKAPLLSMLFLPKCPVPMPSSQSPRDAPSPMPLPNFHLIQKYARIIFSPGIDWEHISLIFFCFAFHRFFLETGTATL